MELDFVELGNRIKEIRKAKNMSQEDLAGLLESERRVISRIENGTQGCSLDFFIKILNALNISSEELLYSFLDYIITPEEMEIRRIIQDCTSNESKIIIHVVKELLIVLREVNK